MYELPLCYGNVLSKTVVARLTTLTPNVLGVGKRSQRFMHALRYFNRLFPLSGSETRTLNHKRHKSYAVCSGEVAAIQLHASASEESAVNTNLLMGRSL